MSTDSRAEDRDRSGDEDDQGEDSLLLIVIGVRLVSHVGCGHCMVDSGLWRWAETRHCF